MTSPHLLAASQEQCRICYSPETEDDRFLTPCDCKGTAGRIHVSCLILDMKERGGCGVCKTEYRVRTVRKPLHKLNWIPKNPVFPGISNKWMVVIMVVLGIIIMILSSGVLMWCIISQSTLSWYYGIIVILPSVMIFILMADVYFWRLSRLPENTDLAILYTEEV